MDTLIYRVGLKTIQLRMKWQFQKYTGFSENIKSNNRKKSFSGLNAHILAVFDHLRTNTHGR